MRCNKSGLSYWSALLAASLLLSACGQSGDPASAEGSSESYTTQARQVLEDYRVPEMMGQVAPIINDSLDTNLPGGVTVTQAERLKKVVSRIFAQERLTGLATAHLREQAEQADREKQLATVHESLVQPLPQRMVKLEDSAATDEFAEGFSQFLKQPVSPDNEPRLAQLRELSGSLHLLELQTEFSVGMMDATIRARNAATPADYKASDESIKRMTTQTRELLTERLDKQLPLLLFYAYRDVSDEDLATYQKLHAEDAIEWVNARIPGAITAALQRAAEDVGPAYEKAVSEG